MPLRTYSLSRKSVTAQGRLRAESLNHGHQLHAVVRGAQFAAKQFFFQRARTHQHAPAAGAGIAFARTICVDLNLIQTGFLPID